MEFLKNTLDVGTGQIAPDLIEARQSNHMNIRFILGGSMVPKCFLEQPPNAISCDCPAENLFRNRDSHSASSLGAMEELEIGRPQKRRYERNRKSAGFKSRADFGNVFTEHCDRGTCSTSGSKRSPIVEQRPLDAESALRSFASRRSTVNFLRPLRRPWRERMKPGDRHGAAMRFKKPCVRFRLILLGWYVLFSNLTTFHQPKFNRRTLNDSPLTCQKLL